MAYVINDLTFITIAGRKHIGIWKIMELVEGELLKGEAEMKWNIEKGACGLKKKTKKEIEKEVNLKRLVTKYVGDDGTFGKDDFLFSVLKNLKM